MKNEDSRENRQRREEVDVPALLQVPRDFPEEAERPLKYDNGARDEADDERRVGFGNELHENLWPEAP